MIPSRIDQLKDSIKREIDSNFVLNQNVIALL
jgi:hypothetical protein